MTSPLPLPLAALPKFLDFIGCTFLLGTLTMWAATAFFLFERSRVAARWRTLLLVAGIVTLVAGTNYAFMTTLWISTGTPPADLRYLDWSLTVPLLCVQFYLLLDAAGAQPGRGMVWRLVIASVWMLAFGYVGQLVDQDQTVLWGAISTLGYAAILLEVSLGEANRLSRTGTDARVKSTYDLLFRFIFIGWAIYPIGYMTRQGNLLSWLHPVLPVAVIYNLGDVVNKVGFGLAVWALAKSQPTDSPAPEPEAKRPI